MLVSTKDMLVKAQKEHYAVANFCIWNVEMLSGVMKACEKLQSPVILSFGSGFLVNTDINHFVNMMRSYATQTSLPCSIHWDHGRSFEIVSHAIDIGYNSLMIDGSAYSFEENIRMTREVVDKFHPMCIPVEAELGHVGAETDYEEALNHYMYTDPSQAAEFVEKTDIDSLAVAIGNQHGAYTAPPQINFEILEKVRRDVSIPLVLHGASGIGDEDIRQDYDTTRTQWNEAEANVTVAKAAVEQATINLQYANVTSPITGVSGKSSVTVGALVTANQADSLVTVQRLDPIYVDLTQSVQDFLRMKEEVASGQIKQVQGSTPVQLNLENGKRYGQTGTLKFSDPTVDETTGSVTLRAIFPNPNGDLLPGMYVTALVDEGSRQNVLLVPQEGVTHNAQGKATALILDKDDVVQLREIEASKAIGDQWVVTSGLQAGDRVIVSGLQRIRPGIKARAISSSQENASTESKQ